MSSRSKRILELCNNTPHKVPVGYMSSKKDNVTITTPDISEKENFNILDLPVDIVNESFIETFGMIDAEILESVETTSLAVPEFDNMEIVHGEVSEVEGLSEATNFADPEFECSDIVQNQTPGVEAEAENAERNITSLYQAYVQHCEKSNAKPMSQNSLTKMVKKLNIALYQPKKDACDICCQYEEKNISEETWKIYQAEKERARVETSKDKEAALTGTQHVLTMDLQAVKVCPSVMARMAYFKTKLCVHHFTVYNLATRDCICYWFDETSSDLQASTFASFIVDYIRKHFNCEKPIIIYSDGCTYQNRNTIMSNALLHLAMDLNVTIEQKFLIKGHTQMECDSVHATIERKLTER
ncbi:unnamed protein product [Acanthoscelides obtectus]|uniref:Uncharacterized protein n=1 Tax=Acanthoscelides obtectus TaxID=200917 RepID=A0A9P0LWL5_ACAOB|nr:unnamed protein product [Acanthoscelides obtectus]CAK1651870.1 hypothetical protein AOBTE_LOCUS17506 [Acanthoscelides obtectus]